MRDNHLELATGYYNLLGSKKIEKLEPYLHPDVELQSPLATLKGREAVIEAAAGFSQAFSTLQIRNGFSDGEHVVLIIDLDCPPPIGKAPAASFLTISGGTITRIELLFDARLFVAQREAIYGRGS